MAVYSYKMITYHVRPCTEEDLKKVIAINEKELPEHYPEYFYRELLEHYGDAFLVAELTDHPGVIVGYNMWRIEKSLSVIDGKLSKRAHLVSIAVSEGFRRLKIATNLLKESMNNLLKYNVSEFVLEVRKSNHPAINLYKRIFGFEANRIIKRYYMDGEDAYFMVLTVNKFRNSKFYGSN